MDVVVEIEDLLTEKECNIIIDAHRGKTYRSEVCDDNVKDGTYVDNCRTNSECSFNYDHKEAVDILNNIEQEISTLTMMPVENIETPIVLHYKENEQYEAHHDYFDIDSEYFKGEIDNGGQRIYSALVYLNTVPAGGETHYPRLDTKVHPEQGKLIAHVNWSAGEPVEDSLHGALPVIEGEKWAIVFWIRENKCR